MTTLLQQAFEAAAKLPAAEQDALAARILECVVPPPKSTNGTADLLQWTDAKNVRRVALIQQKHSGGLSPAEQMELIGLQEEMLHFRQKVAPLPLEDARRLHQELLARAAG
jgi:hypothetical protein